MTSPYVSLICDRCAHQFRTSEIRTLCLPCQRSAHLLRTVTAAELREAYGNARDLAAL